MKHTTAVSGLQVRHKSLGQRILDHWQIYLLLLPAVIYFIIFYYWPMAGLQIAFRDYRVSKGIWGSTWVGLKYFQKFFQHPQCWKIIRNTMVISLYTLATFPLSIIMALLINELRGKKFQKTVQMVTYAPHFISTVVICSMITLFMNQSTGLFNNIIEMAGGKRVDFLGTARYFPHIFVWSGVWQDLGWGTIIYVAALSGVDKSLVEASRLDGANILQKIWYIHVPVLMPTIITLFILQCGSLFSVGYEKVYALQTSQNLMGSEVISTYSYKVGLGEGSDFSFSTTVSLFNSVCNSLILIAANRLARTAGQSGLW